MLNRGPEFSFVNKKLIPSNLNGYRILDLGCGRGFWGWYLRTMDGTAHISGVDLNKDYLEMCRKTNQYDELHLEDVLSFTKEAESEFYDLIVFSHTIEHLSKENGLAIIEEIKRICRGRAIILCPEGNAIEKNGAKYIWDKHISIWRKKDFEKRGFNAEQIRYSHSLGRIITLFEIIWFKVKGLDRGGALVAWWDHL